MWTIAAGTILAVIIVVGSLFFLGLSVVWIRKLGFAYQRWQQQRRERERFDQADRNHEASLEAMLEKHTDPNIRTFLTTLLENHRRSGSKGLGAAPAGQVSVPYFRW